MEPIREKACRYTYMQTMHFQLSVTTLLFCKRLIKIIKLKVSLHVVHTIYQSSKCCAL